MKCRFVSPGSPNDGVLVESMGAPGYCVSEDRWRDDFAEITILEGPRAGLRSACSIQCLQSIEESE